MRSLFLWRSLSFFLLPCLAMLPCSPPVSAQGNNPHIAATPPLAPEEQVKKFHLPPGFVIELVAAEPKINKPINIAFDGAGQLWVTGSVEYPFPAPKGKKPRDAVKILSDFDKNGLARTVSTFADGLNIPIGVLPYPDGKSALIYSIPNLYLMTDTDGDGVADKREVLYTQYGFGDTHGMTGEFMHGFDGWIYCCHGFANTSKVKSKGESAITMTSGNTYRIKADGSRIEHVTHGQVNPFGLAFDSLGNLYSTDCHSRPIYQLLRGAWYPSFGRPHDGLGFGPEMLTHDHGGTGFSGIAYYAAEQFPPEFRDNLFIGNVITNRINRDRIEWRGSTPKGIEMPDFVKCDDPWFRPVDIKLGPDGALYVADFYNRVIGHYEVPLDHPGRDREKGRIWRIRYAGKDDEKRLAVIEDLSNARVTELVAQLRSDNLTVRMQATEQLVLRGGGSIVEQTRRALEQGNSFEKAHGFWVLERLGKLDAKALAGAASDKDRLVRVHALGILRERAAWSEEDRALVLAGLKDGDPFVQRAAAEALGVHSEPRNVAPLLALRQEVPAHDTHLLHVVRMALRDQLRSKGGFDVELAREVDHLAVADVSLGVPTLEAARYLQSYIKRWQDPLPALQRQVHHVVRYGDSQAGAWALAFMQKAFPQDIHLQGQILKTVQQAIQERGGALGKSERAHAEDLALKLLASEPGQVPLGIELAASLRLAGTQGALLKILTSPKAGRESRKNAAVALLAIEPQKNIAGLAALINAESERIELREQIAASLAATNQPAAHAALVKALETAPARLQTTIALGLAGSVQGGERLLDAVAAGKASARLLQERPVELRLQQARVGNLKERLAKLTKGLPAADQRLQELASKRRAGFHEAKPDAALGLKVFEKHCAACHQIANKGTKIGPQLDGIGIRGLERLLEDTLDPNRNVDQAFRSTTLVLSGGQLVQGLFLRQDGKVLVMADNQGKELRTPLDDVQERLVSPLSPMPANWAEVIPDTDFYHLLAYLLAQRTKE